MGCSRLWGPRCFCAESYSDLTVFPSAERPTLLSLGSESFFLSFRESWWSSDLQLDDPGSGQNSAEKWCSQWRVRIVDTRGIFKYSVSVKKMDFGCRFQVFSSLNYRNYSWDTTLYYPVLHFCLWPYVLCVPIWLVHWRFLRLWLHIPSLIFFFLSRGSICEYNGRSFQFLKYEKTCSCLTSWLERVPWALRILQVFLEVFLFRSYSTWCTSVIFMSSLSISTACCSSEVGFFFFQYILKYFISLF